MTCIVGMEVAGGVIIGGDSAGVAGYALTVRADEKVFLRGRFPMGFTTSFRMGQLLRYAPLTIKVTEADRKDPDAFMATKFVNAVRKTLQAGGYASKQNEVEAGGTFLVGFGSRLYRVDSDYQIGRSLTGYDAVGCGAQIALGALHASDGLAPKDRLLSALAAAADHNAGVCAPFTFVTNSRRAL